MMTLEDIKQAIRGLTVEQRKQLIAFVVDSLAEREDEGELHSILEFEGIAAHQADDEDPQLDFVQSNSCIMLSLRKGFSSRGDFPNVKFLP